jgi:hypothetical protein
MNLKTGAIQTQKSIKKGEKIMGFSDICNRMPGKQIIQIKPNYIFHKKKLMICSCASVIV